MTEALLFASTFVTVFALGLQSQNVNGGHYLAAFLTSFVIGGASLVLYRYLPDPSVPQVAAYLLGGATGIVASMWTHRRTIGRAKRSGKVEAPQAWPNPPRHGAEVQPTRPWPRTSRDTTDVH